MKTIYRVALLNKHAKKILHTRTMVVSSAQPQRLMVMDCSQKFQLIELWEEHPVLWDPANPDRLRKDAQRKAREAIAAKLGVEEDLVKKTINGLKAQLSGECSKVRKGGKDGSEVYTSKWVYYSALQFLVRGKSKSDEKDPLNNTLLVKNERIDKYVEDNFWDDTNSSSTTSPVPSINFDVPIPTSQAKKSSSPKSDRRTKEKTNTSSDEMKLLSKCVDIMAQQLEPKKAKTRATILGESTSSLLETLWAEDFTLYKEYAMALRNLNNKYEQAYEERKKKIHDIVT